MRRPLQAVSRRKSFPPFAPLIENLRAAIAGRTMQYMKTERRRRRSDHRFVAAEFYLEAACRRAHATAAALASHDGLVVSGTGPDETVTVLGVLGPTPVKDLAQQISCGQKIHSTKLDLGGARFYLTSLGGKPIPADEARAAFERILFA
jgi:hypothetical protein